ncbi:MAG: TetR family transcriptional regulator [Xanthomonadaceae bacterium]|nr:TetR family transcriptional regulator [Xanthomonadaceae bacterium]
MTAQEELDTKELLLQKAIEIFSVKGFDGATVKDLAEAAGVNVSLVSYYFGGKEGLYNACISKFGQAKLQFLEQVLTPAESIADFKAKTKIWITQFLSWAIEESAKVRMIHREMDCGLPLMKEAFQGTFMKTFIHIRTFISDAQTKGFVRRSLDPQEIAALLQGVLMQSIRIDPIRSQFFGASIKDEQFRKHHIEQILEIVFGGMIND